MLLQTNSYVVPRDRKGEHARLVRRFRQTFARLGCDSFEVFEQVGSNWSSGESSGRFVQIMRFRDRRHQLAVQEAERNDPDAQGLIAEFCELINFPYQRQQGLFAVGFYIGVLPSAPRRQAELVDKTVAADELEEETTADQQEEADAKKKPAAPAEPAKLVEPGAATRAPIVTPISPGQVPIITPAPLEHPASVAEELTTSPDVDEQTTPIDFDAEIETEEPARSQAIGSPAGPASIAIPAAPAPGESAQTPAERWQTSDEIDPNADLSLDLSDTDESGNIRVADPELLQAEAEFAEYVADPVGAFDEIKPKPPVVEGVLLDDLHHDADAIPMNDDDALEALQLPDAAGSPAPLPKINGQAGQNHFEDELAHLREDEHESDIDESVGTDPSNPRKTTPSQHDEIHH